MSSEVFYWALNMSIHGAVVCLLVLALRRLPFLSPGARYALWLAPMLRLLCPVSVQSRFSLMALLKPHAVRAVQVFPELNSILISFSTMNSVQLAESYDPVAYADRSMEGFFSVAAAVWVGVAGAFLLAAAFFYGRTLWQLRGAQPVRKGVYVSEKVSSPAIYGILRPKIILPPQAKSEKYVLLHERVHRRRLDNLWRVVAVSLCCVYWFQLIVWLCLKFFFEDMELSCDAAAVRKLPPTERKDYALALLDYAQKEPVFVSPFGGAGVRSRIEAVLSYRRLTFISTLAFGILTGAIIAFLTLN